MRIKIAQIFSQYKADFKNTAALLLIDILKKLSSFVSIYFIVRAVSQEAYGQYQFILSCIVLANIMTLTGAANAILQSIARGYYGSYRLLQKIAFYCSFIGTLALVLFAGWNYFLGNEEVLAYNIIFGAIMLPLSNGLLHWQSVRIGQEKFTSLLKWSGLSTILTHAGIVAAVLIFPENIIAPLAGFLVVPALFNLYATYYCLKLIPKDQPEEKGILRYSIFTSLYNAPLNLATHIDKILLFYFVTPVALALYVTAEKFPFLARDLTRNLAMAMAPRFARWEVYTKKNNATLLMISCLFSICLFIGGYIVLPYAILFLFGEKYEDAIPYAIALIGAEAIRSLAFLQIRLIYSRLDVKAVRNISLFMAGTKIVTAFIAIPLYGIEGAIFSIFATNIVYVLVVQVSIYRNYLNVNKEMVTDVKNS